MKIHFFSAQIRLQSFLLLKFLCLHYFFSAPWIPFVFITLQELKRVLDLGSVLEACDFAVFWSLMKGEYKVVNLFIPLFWLFVDIDSSSPALMSPNVSRFPKKYRAWLKLSLALRKLFEFVCFLFILAWRKLDYCSLCDAILCRCLQSDKRNVPKYWKGCPEPITRWSFR